MTVPHKWAQICWLASTNLLAIARQFAVANQQIFVHLWGTIMQGPYSRSMKTSKLRVTGLCEGNSSVTGEFPAKRASNAENVSIWWRQYVSRDPRKVAWCMISRIWKWCISLLSTKTCSHYTLHLNCLKTLISFGPSSWSFLTDSINYSHGHHRRFCFPLQWRHDMRDSVSNNQPHNCLLDRLFRRRSKKTSKLRVTGLCTRNSPGTGEFPAQMASNAENVSIWWRHHVRVSTLSSDCPIGNYVMLKDIENLSLPNQIKRT